ncbi:fimbrial protein [Lasius niger]|uniref:Fimbrial protein n=1 Tax=Lasius niger TaxID=67767 RepID=A0A0J7L4D1_LASNI|nr:fimbrial protein [Lasius niger]
MFKVTVPLNAAANTSGKLQLNMNGFNKIVDVVVSSPFPKAPATGIDPGAATTGLTVTKVDATNWNVSLSLAGASKKLNVVLVPAGAFQFKFVADNLADSTVIGIGPDGGATPSFTITPKKVGSTTVMIRHQGFTGDADPFVKLTVTVTA